MFFLSLGWFVQAWLTLQFLVQCKTENSRSSVLSVELGLLAFGFRGGWQQGWNYGYLPLFK